MAIKLEVVVVAYPQRSFFEQHDTMAQAVSQAQAIMEFGYHRQLNRHETVYYPLHRIHEVRITEVPDGN